MERLPDRSSGSDQLHNLVEPEEWETAFAPGGALEAVIEAKEQGLVSHIGVTGHGVTGAAQHLRSLERYPFDSVLLPYNFAMSNNTAYLDDFEALVAVCAERNVAVQTIKSITRAPWGDREQTASTWYEPLTDQGAIDTAVAWVLGRDGLFLNTVGDVTILPSVLAAAAKVTDRPDAEAMRSLEESFGLRPLFVSSSAQPRTSRRAAVIATAPPTQTRSGTPRRWASPAAASPGSRVQSNWDHRDPASSTVTSPASSAGDSAMISSVTVGEGSRSSSSTGPAALIVKLTSARARTPTTSVPVTGGAFALAAR